MPFLDKNVDDVLDSKGRRISNGKERFWERCHEERYYDEVLRGREISTMNRGVP